MKYDKQQILELRQSNKTYKEIAEIIGCSEWTVKYHTMPCRKLAQDNYSKNVKITNPLSLKKRRFMVKGTVIQFTLEQLINKIGDNPKCYLTGELIDLLKPETYSLDHIIPLSRGGKSSLENCGLMKLDINQAKYNLTPDEFIDLCFRVVANLGVKPKTYP